MANYSWVTIKDIMGVVIKQDLTLENRDRIRREFGKVLIKLINEYPDPVQWFKTPIEDKKDIRHNDVTQSYIIIFWAWKNSLFIHPEYDKHLIQYLMGVTNRSISTWALWLGLITKDEYSLIKSKKSSSILKRICLLCFILNKPLREFSDTDAKEVPKYLIDSSMFSSKRLQDIRIELGYTSHIIKRASQVWTAVYKNNPEHRDLLEEYHMHLVRAKARSQYIKNVGSSLKKFFDYLSSSGLSNCRNLSQQHIGEFLDGLRKEVSIRHTVNIWSKVKKFLLWGSGHSDFFPAILELPDSYLKSLVAAAVDEGYKSPTLAFKERGHADLLVNTLLNFKTNNELDELYRDFWLLIAVSVPRFNLIRNLEAFSCLKPMPNNQSAYGIYTGNPDKSGRIYGQYPLVDKKLGLEVIDRLQKRAIDKKFNPIENPDSKRVYVHLFQLDKYPYIVDNSTVRKFIKRVTQDIPELSGYERIGGHGFRHHNTVHIVAKTRNIRIGQVALGHKESTMTERYLQSDIAKETLLHEMVQKYDDGEITGDYICNLIEIITANTTPKDELFAALMSDVTLDEFIQKFGRRTPWDMGNCMRQDSCDRYFKCWSCPSFLLKREEIAKVIGLLTKQYQRLFAINTRSQEFRWNHPYPKQILSSIILMTKRLGNLGISKEIVTEMVKAHNSNVEIGDV